MVVGSFLVVVCQCVWHDFLLALLLLLCLSFGVVFSCVVMAAHGELLTDVFVMIPLAVSTMVLKTRISEDTRRDGFFLLIRSSCSCLDCGPLVFQ